MSRTNKSTKNVVVKGSRTVANKVRNGEYTKIAEATGYDASHVWRVVNGKRSNPSGEIMRYTNKLVGRRK